MCLGEDGLYGVPGYAVVNNEYTVVEHTCMSLPQAIYQADYMSGALGHHDAPPAELSDEDIILN